MNNQTCLSDLRHQESDDVSHAPTQKKLHAQPHLGRDHYSHFNIDNEVENGMLKDDEKDEELHQRRVQGQNDDATRAISHDQVRQIIASDTADNSKPSSIVSQGSLGDTHLIKQQQKLYQTPQVDKRYQAKFSTFENSELFSGARENQYTSNYSTNEKKAQGNHSEENSQKSNDPYLNQTIQDQHCQDNQDLSVQSYNAANDSHENSSMQKAGSFSLIKERERRSCRDKTSKYSLTHKGVYSNIQAQEDQALNQNTHLSRRSLGQQPLNDHPHHTQPGHETSFTQGLNREGRVDGKPLKKSAPRTSEQCLNTIKSMFAFDWSLKDIGNLRHSPQQELTSAIYWFYVNTQYFPFKALELSQQPLEDLILPILQNLKPNNNYKNKNYEELKQQSYQPYDNNNQQVALNSTNINQDYNQNQININDKNDQNANDYQSNQDRHSQSIDNQQLNRDIPQLQYEAIPDFIMTLHRDKRFRKFKKQYKELQDRLQLELKQKEEASNIMMKTDVNEPIINNEQNLQQEIIVEDNAKPLQQKQEEEDQVQQQQQDQDDIDVMMECQETIQGPQEKQSLAALKEDSLDIDIDIVKNQEEEEKMRIIEEQKQMEEQRQKQQQIQEQANRDYNIMIEILQREIDNIEGFNRDQLQIQAQNLKNAFQVTLNSDPTQKDMFVYKQEDMLNYDLSFLAQIDPLLINDFLINSEWYQDNYNEILLNVGHPSKLEKDFLKHIEYIQQKKSDMKYKKILKQIEQGKRGDQISLAELEQYQTLNSARNQVGQEDAQCAICNNGDYEEEDMIVFCGNCNVPVHQSCYGIEQLPEGDWICYNCDIFGMKRGIMINCLLCPKKGGAMKPTNIFSTFENYRKFNQGNSSHAKKTIKKHHHYNQSVSEKISLVDNLTPEKRVNIGENEDKNLSLTVILNREFNYQSDLRQKYEKLEIPLETLDLIFDANEKITETPEDYSVFLHKNEARLESHIPTECLYQWVHLSCASWIPGPLVTPKTPVRLNKFDEKRFLLQCIICLKKDGACMQCQASRCTIAFHVECARRNNYCMEIERKDRDKTYRMFCEKHRPLKIVKEMEERDKQTIEEIQKFCKIIDKCMEIDYRHQLKPSKHHDKEKELLRQQQIEKEQTKQQHVQSKSIKAQKPPKPEKIKKEKMIKEKKIKEVVKKWREKDKKMLFERVKEKYLMFRKMRINIIRIDPMKKFRKTQKSQPTRKRSKKRTNKKQQAQSHIGGSRPGLRSTHGSGVPGSGNNGQGGFEEDKQQDLLQLQNEIMMQNANNNNNNSQEEQKMDYKALDDSTMMNQEYTQGGMLGGDQTTENMQDQTVNMDEDQDVYYKLSIPTYPTEIDWTITLSRNDFPWPEIKFNNFTAKDCYEKYLSIVKDPSSFLKKVLGLKEKYKKMMQNQLALAQQIQIHQPGLQSIPQGVVLTNAQEAALYCKCKGAVISDLYVKCDGDDECTNGGWVHPQCTEELKYKSKEELDAIEEWYCEECQVRIKKEDEEVDEEQKEEEEEDEEDQEDQEQDGDDDNDDNGDNEGDADDDIADYNDYNHPHNIDYGDNNLSQHKTIQSQNQHYSQQLPHSSQIGYDDNKQHQFEEGDDQDMLLEEPDEQELQEAYLRENNYNIRINNNNNNNNNISALSSQNYRQPQNHLSQQQLQYLSQDNNNNNNNNNNNYGQGSQNQQSPSSQSSSSSDGGCF